MQMMVTTSWGFIITRCVRSPETNWYWNHCVYQIRRFHPTQPIVIIDDNSIPQFVREVRPLDSNIQVVHSEYPGRGELLPYVYLLKYKWFNAAVIMHDSSFLQAPMPILQALQFPVIPLWHHPFDTENIHLIYKHLSVLKNGTFMKSLCMQRQQCGGGGGGTGAASFLSSPFIPAGLNFNLCFGCQSVVKLRFLQQLELKYNFSRLVETDRTRPDRCALERVLGILIHLETGGKIMKSLFGNIRNHAYSFKYNIKDYVNDKRRGRRLKQLMIKVWTGR